MGTKHALKEQIMAANAIHLCKLWCAIAILEKAAFFSFSKIMHHRDFAKLL